MDEVNWNALQWEVASPLLIRLSGLANFQAAETDVALSPDLSSEQRHYLSGKAVALAEFKDHLKHLREMAIQNKK